ncbi:hypothetical protein FH972_023127 [Carpinus fangiana]|uniref:Beta-lactamase-related domain-containing protein n=1 Tax=Carpinus fangiana TaxID=176857 RepID=A0A5N6KU97_9ROSI|nr:hypothetical protein FH972_023127 [Carpinus fangiana]
MPLAKTAQAGIQSCLDETTKAGSGTPGLVFCAIDKNGEYLSETVSGVNGVEASIAKPMTLDSVFWIASCTKMITGIACLQLHEQGKLSIDSADELYKLCPEMKSKKVLVAPGKYEDLKGEITIRKLLTHTAGFGYSFFNERLRDAALPAGWDEFSGDAEDYLNMPLVNQPGSRWEYGINIDWAGIAVMRATGLNLDDYFKRHIFAPLGIENISFFPSAHMKENLVNAQYVRPDGTVINVDHLYRRPVALAGTSKQKDIFTSGGAGCFAKPREYCQIIATLLNNGTSPTTKKQILKPATVDLMFENSIPEFPDFGRTAIPNAKPFWTNPLPQLYPQEGDPGQGWGLSFMLTIEPGPTGRGRNTAWWAGIANLFWWADREKGVGGIIAAQKVPFGDGAVMGAWGNCEAQVYAGLS